MRVGVSLFAAVGVLLAGGVAHADESPDLGEAEVISHDPVLSSEAMVECDAAGIDYESDSLSAESCVDAFWTDERIAQALFNSGNDSQVASSSPMGNDGPAVCQSEGTVELGDWTDDVPSDGIWPPGVTESYDSRMVGILLSTRPTVDAICGNGPFHYYACTASAVKDSVGVNSLIVTAGHCVHEGSDGTWHENVMFMPAWNGVDYMRGNLGGSYGVETVGVLPGYIEHKIIGGNSPESNYHDVAFGVPGKDTSHFQQLSLGERVGGYGISFNDTSDFDAVLLGYPHFDECEGTETPQSHDCTDIDVDNREVVDVNHTVTYVPGGLMLGCEGLTQGDRLGNPLTGPKGLLVSDCGFVGGASGGPWLSDFDESTGYGTVRAVLSGTTGGGVVMATYFGDEVEDLYTCVTEISFGYDECRDEWDTEDL